MMRTLGTLVVVTALLQACSSSGEGTDVPPPLIDVGESGAGVTDARGRPLDFTPFEDSLDTFDEGRRVALDALTRDGDIARLRTALASGETTSRELVLFHLARIRASDAALASVIELNPDALAEADRLDARRRDGQASGRLHGLPILLKDNIATGDGLRNTAGAAVLAGHRPPRDAFVVARLREAGAVILGKTNLSEWAYFMASAAPSGYSAIGGQTVNPFGAELAVLGSSTGSAVAAAARFAVATLGTETTGSIVAPAAANGVAGMRPTLGLVSADLIVPVSAPLDTAGPIARTVTDLAELLGVMAARDGDDPNAPLAGDVHGTDFTDGLEDTSLDGLRVGVPAIARPIAGSADEAVFARVVSALEDGGARVVPVALPGASVETLARHHLRLLAGGMAHDLAAYLARSDAPVGSLAEVVAFNAAAPSARAPFGQDLLVLARDERLDPALRNALAARLRRVALEAIATAASSGDEAPAVDVLLSLDNTFSLVYALAGVPAVTVPAGLDAAGQPHGATFVGLAPGTDARTLAIARAFEREAALRPEPPGR